MSSEIFSERLTTSANGQAVGMAFPGCEISKRADGGRTFRIFDPVLTFIRVGAQVGLQFGAAELIIETPFVLRMSGEDHVLDPENRRTLGPLLRLWPDVVAGIEMSRMGHFALPSRAVRCWRFLPTSDSSPSISAVSIACPAVSQRRSLSEPLGSFRHAWVRIGHGSAWRLVPTRAASGTKRRGDSRLGCHSPAPGCSSWESRDERVASARGRGLRSR